MKIGITIDPRHPSIMQEIAQEAEAGGIDLIACGDSQSMYREVHTTLTLIAETTDSPRLALVATNPVTRHITVTASATATLDEISNGRAVLGMAIGDSAVKNTELDQASLPTLKRAIETLDELFEYGTSEWRGETINVRWPNTDIPIYLTGEGPKTLTVGGEVADGVFNGGWISKEEVEWAKSRVANGANRADRDPSDLDFWTAAPCDIVASKDSATNRLRHILAAKAHIVSMGDLERSPIPAHLVPNFRKFGEDYRSDLHNQRDDPYNAELLVQHGLLTFMKENMAITGTAEKVAEQLNAISGWGVDGVLLAIRTEDPIPSIRRLGEEVLPSVSQGGDS